MVKILVGSGKIFGGQEEKTKINIEALAYIGDFLSLPCCRLLIDTCLFLMIQKTEGVIVKLTRNAF